MCGDPVGRLPQCASKTARHLAAGDALTFRAFGFVVLPSWYKPSNAHNNELDLADQIDGGEIAAQLLARPVRPIVRSLAIVVGGWHHDSAPHPLTEVALHVYNHAQRGDDALRFLPGSHALPTGLNPRDIASLAHADPRACPGEFGGVAVPAEPGDVIAFDARLWRHYPGSGALAARLLRFRVLNVNEADGAGTTLTIERPDREG